MALLLYLLACDDPTPPRQSTPVQHDGPVHVTLGPTGPVKDPVSPEQLAAVYPALSALEERAAAGAVGAMNLVPAPCTPCEGSLATCALAPPAGCENIPTLVERAARMAGEGSAPETIRDALSYGDAWVFDPTAAQTEAIDVEVWIDPSAPSAPGTLARMAAVEEARQGVPIRWHLRVLWDAEVDEEQGAALALLAAEEQAVGRAWLLAGGAAPGVIPDPGVFEARRSDPALAARLEAEQVVARSKGVRSAPTWFVEGYRLRGLQGEGSIVHLIKQSWEGEKLATSPQPAEAP